MTLKLIKSLFIAILVSSLVTSCSSDENKSTENEILSFSINDNPGLIDNVSKTITVEVPWDIDLSKLSPKIVVSSDATVKPSSDIEVDFSKGKVIYIVTAENGESRAYNVNVSNAEDPSIILNIDYVDPRTIHLGGTIALTGSFYAKGNIVELSRDDKVVKLNVVSENKEEIKVLIPTDMKIGGYDISVTSPVGKQKVSYPYRVWVLNEAKISNIDVWQPEVYNYPRVGFNIYGTFAKDPSLQPIMKDSKGKDVPFNSYSINVKENSVLIERSILPAGVYYMSIRTDSDAPSEFYELTIAYNKIDASITTVNGAITGVDKISRQWFFTVRGAFSKNANTVVLIAEDGTKTQVNSRDGRNPSEEISCLPQDLGLKLGTYTLEVSSPFFNSTVTYANKVEIVE